MKDVFFRTFLLVTLLVPFSVSAQALEAVQELQLLLNEFQSLKGKFSQSLSDAEGNALQDSEGDFIVQRPGKIVWHTEAPFEQVLVSDQQTLWLYDPDLEQVTVQKTDERLQQTPLLLLSGDVNRISEYFAVEKVSETQFELRPLTSEAAFQNLLLSFEEKRLKQVLLSDGLGQTTELNFSETEANQAFDPETFTFHIPPGTDIIRDE